MPAIVPFTSDPWQRFRCTLGGVEYTFEANYNDRSGVWNFDIYRASDEALLVASVPIVLGCDMLAPFALGIGTMFAVDLAASPEYIQPVAAPPIPAMAMLDADPQGAFNDDLGARVIVTYLSPAELGA